MASQLQFWYHTLLKLEIFDELPYKVLIVTQTWSEGLDDLKNAAGGVCGAVSLSSGCFFFMPVTGRKLPSFRSIPNIGYRSRFDVMITKY